MSTFRWFTTGCTQVPGTILVPRSYRTGAACDRCLFVSFFGRRATTHMELPPLKRSHHAPPKPPKPDTLTQLMTSFFQKPPPPPRRVGRPAGLPPKKRGRPAAASSSSDAAASETLPRPAPTVDEEPAPSAAASVRPMGKRDAAEMVGAKLRRTNWSHGEALERLTKAVEDWDAKSFSHLPEVPKMTLTRYADLVGIPYPTLAHYCCEDRGKRKQLGKSVGKPSLFSDEEKQFAVDVIRRHDRGNDGLNKRECVPSTSCTI